MEPGISMTTNWNCTISVTSFVITSSNHTKYIEVMNMLGPSLWDIWSSLGQSMTPKSTACASKASL
ncbi:hypothetical protein Hanom_Chr15g01362241 [Helianthus anomalus]